jgi:hypothetical protein
VGVNCNSVRLRCPVDYARGEFHAGSTAAEFGTIALPQRHEISQCSDNHTTPLVPTIAN